MLLARRGKNKTPYQKSTLVKHNNLGSLLSRLDEGVYDLQGLEMKFHGCGDPTITTNDVTLCNGSIALKGRQSFRVEGQNVVLDSITVFGGDYGVHVFEDASLTMKGCKVQDANIGVYMDNNSSLVASGFKVLSCSDASFSLWGKASVRLTDCEVSGASDGIIMHGKSKLTGTLTHMSSTQPSVVKMYGHATCSLGGCTLTRDSSDP